MRDPKVWEAIVTDGRTPTWSPKRTRWIKEYQLPVYRQAILEAVSRRKVRHAQEL